MEKKKRMALGMWILLIIVVFFVVSYCIYFSRGVSSVLRSSPDGFSMPRDIMVTTVTTQTVKK